MAIIAFSGTPGTGKTTLALEFSKRHKFRYIDINLFAREHGLFSGYDGVKGCYVLDTNKLSRAILPELKGNVVVDSHLSHYIPNLDLYVITGCSVLSELKHRLEQRGYGKAKISENLESEILKVCLVDALEFGRKVLQLDTCKLSKETCLRRIWKAVKTQTD